MALWSDIRVGQRGDYTYSIGQLDRLVYVLLSVVKH